MKFEALAVIPRLAVVAAAAGSLLSGCGGGSPETHCNGLPKIVEAADGSNRFSYHDDCLAGTYDPKNPYDPEVPADKLHDSKAKEQAFRDHALHPNTPFEIICRSLYSNPAYVIAKTADGHNRAANLSAPATLDLDRNPRGLPECTAVQGRNQ